MINEIGSMLVPVFLIVAGYYIKIAKDREPYATPGLWKTAIILGSVLLAIRIIMLIIKYT